jgi:hypothetical protein
MESPQAKKIKGSHNYATLYKGLTYFKSPDKELNLQFKEELSSLLDRCGDEFIGELVRIILDRFEEDGLI